MPTVPALQVLLDNSTGTFPIDITTKVLSAEEYGGYSITRGRDDWQGAVTAGELTLTLNNSDGRFSPGSTILGTPSPIKVDQRIRVKETVNGVTLTRFTGYVKSWPVAWPATVTTFSTVAISATDAQARAERRTLRSMLEEEILLDSPDVYYTLGEASGSTAAGDTSGNAGSPLSIISQSVTFGDGTGPADGLSAAAFNAGQLADSPSVVGFGGTTPIPSVVTVGAWFATTTTPGFSSSVMNFHGWAIQIGNTGEVLGGGSLTGGLSVTDGANHFAMVTSDGTTETLYVDGVAVASAATHSGNAVPRLTVGGEYIGTASHVAVWSVALTAGQVADIYAAGTGTETTDARVTRIASYAGLTTGTIDTSTTVVGAQDTSDSSAQQTLQDVADTEMGLVYIDGSGNLTFHSRSRGAVKTVPDLILDSQYVTPDVQPTTDDQNIVNYVEATSAGTGATQVAQNATSQTSHGRYPESNTYLVTTDAEALDRGTWIVYKQAEPTLRYGTLTINLYKMTTAVAAVVIAALDLGCWLRVTSLASQNPGGTVADVVVQGFNEQTTGESWSITCNVTARSLEVTSLWDDSNSTWDTAVWAV